MTSLDPRIVTVWRLQGLVTPVVLAVAALVADLVARSRGVEPPWPPGSPAGVVLAAGVAAALVAPAVAYRRWRYLVADETLEVAHGVVVHTRSSIPYYRVQHVDVSAGPLDRLCGVARLVVHTASATTDATIPGIAAAEVDDLRAVILERAGSGDAV